MLDETSCDIRVEDGVDFFRKDRVEPVRAGLNRLSSSFQKDAGNILYSLVSTKRRRLRIQLELTIERHWRWRLSPKRLARSKCVGCGREQYPVGGGMLRVDPPQAVQGGRRGVRRVSQCYQLWL